MKLTVQTFLTLDGVMQAPGGPEEDPRDGFTHGGWQAPFPDPAVGEFVTELNGHASAFLFGRRTFDIFRGYWPDQTDPDNPIATAINSLPKYVVSNSLSEADATWRGEHPDTARLVTGDVVAAVQALKDEPGDELQIWGSGKLLQTLLQHELVGGLAADLAERHGRSVHRAARPLASGDDLTARELAVLALLPTDLTLREVAGTHYVSLNTVKSQTRSIYRKLGATTRDEAVVRARQLGLA